MAVRPYSTKRVDIVRLPGAEVEGDVVAVEEPLEIRLNGVAVAVTMRTPGHDEELALGFCVSEGLAPRSARLPDDLAVNVSAMRAASTATASSAPLPQTPHEEVV